MLHCPRCHATLWRPLVETADDDALCPECGSPMTVERRRPGRTPRVGLRERRDAAPDEVAVGALEMSAS